MAKVDRHAPLFVIFEDGNKLEAGPESLEVLPKCRNSDVVGVLELGDRALGDLEPTCSLSVSARSSDRRATAPGRSSTFLRSSENLVRAIRSIPPFATH